MCPLVVVGSVALLSSALATELLDRSFWPSDAWPLLTLSLTPLLVGLEDVMMLIDQARRGGWGLLWIKVTGEKARHVAMRVDLGRTFDR